MAYSTEKYSTIPSERQFVDGKYHLPNDSVEHQRLDAQSQTLIALMQGEPFHAPLPAAPRRIIDVGCGTGTMTTMLAAAYPDAQVIGVDISAVPEARHAKLPNLEYVQGDIHELVREGKDPRFALGTVDYIFERLLILGMTDWPSHVKTVTSLLRPGGWLEIQDIDMMMRSASEERVAEKWWHWPRLDEDARAFGLEIGAGWKLKGYMDSVGLRNVQETVFYVPCVSKADRPEMDGMGDNIVRLFILFKNRVSVPRRSAEEAQRMEDDIKELFKVGEKEDHHFNMHAVIGQKA